MKKDDLRKKVNGTYCEKCKHHNYYGYGLIGSIKETNGLLKVVERFKKRFIKSYPNDEDRHLFRHKYENKTQLVRELFDFYVELFEYLDIDSNKKDLLERFYYRFLECELNESVDSFNNNLNKLRRLLMVSDQLVIKKLNRLNKIESFRLSESIRCLGINANVASVVMSVSAVEHRLHVLLLKINKRLYKKEFEKRALGGILELFKPDSSKYANTRYNKFKRIMPEKHKPLMVLLNTYRVYSAHRELLRVSPCGAQPVASLTGFSCYS